MAAAHGPIPAAGALIAAVKVSVAVVHPVVAVNTERIYHFLSYPP